MPEDKDNDVVPKRMWRRLKELEGQMRELFGTWVRIREIAVKIEAHYAITQMETYLAANTENLRDQAIRHFLLGKLSEFYRFK